jgi:hypothetical protein
MNDKDLEEIAEWSCVGVETATHVLNQQQQMTYTTYEIPVYTGRRARRGLTRMWGLPNACPRLGEPLFGRSRVVFVDDDQDGQPMAYWVPENTKEKT